MTLFVWSLLLFRVSSKGNLISPYLWLNNIHAVYLKWNQFIEVVLRKLGNFENLIRTVYKTCSNSISWAWTFPSIIQTKRLLLVSNDAWFDMKLSLYTKDYQIEIGEALNYSRGASNNICILFIYRASWLLFGITFFLCLLLNDKCRSFHHV